MKLVSNEPIFIGPEKETFEEYVRRSLKVMIEVNKTASESEKLRFGQTLFNCLPARLYGKVPLGLDPFYDNDKVELFLIWLERRWND